MSIAIDQELGKYVYGIIRVADRRSLMEPTPLGLNDRALEVVPVGQVAAVVSSAEIVKLRPQRRLLAAHQQVVDWLSRSCAMLPVAFGLIANDQHDLEDLIAKNESILVERLSAVEGRVEMTVALSWVVDNIFQHFVDNHEDLRNARDLALQKANNRDELIQVGRMFDQLLRSERDRLSNRVIDGLLSCTEACELQSPKSEKEVLRAAFLMERHQLEDFERAIYEVAKTFDERYAFSFSGPWPPYSFVKLNLA